MPLTHDIGVRIPYPLLETDNFGCLFFLFIRLLYAELASASPYAFRPFVLASKLAYNSPNPNLCFLLYILHDTNSSVVHMTFQTKRGVEQIEDVYCSASLS